MTDTITPEEIIADGEYAPERIDAEGIAFLRTALGFAERRGDADLIRHYRDRLALADMGLTLADAAALDLRE